MEADLNLGEQSSNNCKTERQEQQHVMSGQRVFSKRILIDWSSISALEGVESCHVRTLQLCQGIVALQHCKR